MPRTYPKLTERRIVVDLTDADLQALNAYCTSRRRATGEQVPRSSVVREALKRLIADRGTLTDPNVSGTERR